MIAITGLLAHRAHRPHWYAPNQGVVFWGVSMPLLGLCLVGCGAHLPSSPEDRLSPSGLFLIMPGDYGHMNDGHDEMAEAHWRRYWPASAGGTPRAFPVVLHRWLVRSDGAHYFMHDGKHVSGWYDGESIHVMGHPGYSQSWRHEMTHYLFDATIGDSDHYHRRPAWRSCNLMMGLHEQADEVGVRSPLMGLSAPGAPGT